MMDAYKAPKEKEEAAAPAAEAAAPPASPGAKRQPPLTSRSSIASHPIVSQVKSSILYGACCSSVLQF